MPPIKVTLLEKAATDNGFDLVLPRAGAWLAFASSQAPLKLWLSLNASGAPIAALSRRDVAKELAVLGASVPMTAPPPTAEAAPWPNEAFAALVVVDFVELHRLLRRAFQLARTLPDELLHVFEKATAALARTTEAEKLVVQRVGQGIFRDGQLAYWEGRCAVTGLAIPELLRASHIKPWADSTDAERLDIFNGLLLAPHLDAAFDKGFITVVENGDVLVSPAMSAEARSLLTLDRPLRVASLAEGHHTYLPWHRTKLFRNE